MNNFLMMLLDEARMRLMWLKTLKLVFHPTELTKDRMRRQTGWNCALITVIRGCKTIIKLYTLYCSKLMQTLLKWRAIYKTNAESVWEKPHKSCLS